MLAFNGKWIPFHGPSTLEYGDLPREEEMDGYKAAAGERLDGREDGRLAD